MNWPQPGDGLKDFMRLVGIGFAYRGRSEVRVKKEKLRRDNQEEVSSIVPRHFELRQWQANLFFDSSVIGSSISSA